MKNIALILLSVSLTSVVFAGSVVAKEKRKVAQVESEESNCSNVLSQAERNVCEHEAYDKLNRKLIDTIEKKCLNSPSVQEFSPDGTGYSAAIVRCKASITGQLIQAADKAIVD